MFIWIWISCFSIDQWERFQQEFSKRKVIPSKLLNLPYFTKVRFLFIPTLKNLKLDFIASLNEPYFDDITKAFYSNLEPQDNSLGIQIEVFGTTILL